MIPEAGVVTCSPNLRPSMRRGYSCFLLSFIRSIADFGTPVVIGGRFETVSTEIYMQVIGYSRLDKSKMVKNGFTPLPTWQDALRRYLKEIGM